MEIFREYKKKQMKPRIRKVDQRQLFWSPGHLHLSQSVLTFLAGEGKRCGEKGGCVGQDQLHEEQSILKYSYLEEVALQRGLS